MTQGSDDPFAAVAALHGVGTAAAHARDAMDALLRHPAMRSGAGRVAAAAAVAGARASAALEAVNAGEHTGAGPAYGTGPRDPGGPAPGHAARAGDGEPDDAAGPDDPVLAGALRVAAEIPELAAQWTHSPLRVLARLHLLAARDLVASADELGRPRPDPAGVVRSRLDQFARHVTAPTTAPGAVVAAIVHGEIASLAPFGTADGVVARAAERVVLVARGVDTKVVSVPEAGHLRAGAGYRSALGSYASGTPAGVGLWVRHCCEAYAAGAEEALRLAAELTS